LIFSKQILQKKGGRKGPRPSQGRSKILGKTHGNRVCSGVCRYCCWKIAISAVKVVAVYACKFVQNCRKFVVNKKHM